MVFVAALGSLACQTHCTGVEEFHNFDRTNNHGIVSPALWHFARQVRFLFWLSRLGLLDLCACVCVCGCVCVYICVCMCARMVLLLLEAFVVGVIRLARSLNVAS